MGRYLFMPHLMSTAAPAFGSTVIKNQFLQESFASSCNVERLLMERFFGPEGLTVSGPPLALVILGR